jgi:hypothetical protein
MEGLVLEWVRLRLKPPVSVAKPFGLGRRTFPQAEGKGMERRDTGRLSVD